VRKSLDYLGILSIFLFIISASIAFVLFFTPLYKWSAVHLDVPQAVNMDRETLFQNYHLLMDYLTKPWVNELYMPDFPSSPNGLFHFYEVKNLFLLNNSILLVSGVISGVFLYHIKKQRRIWMLIRPFFFMMFIPIVLLFFVFTNFDTVFVLFHKLAFNNDMWIFNASTDPVILALPQEFFMYCFITVFLFIEILFGAGYLWSKNTGFKKR